MNESNYRPVVRYIMILSALSCSLLIGRLLCTQQLSFTFLVWNLFLALTPLFIALRIDKLSNRYEYYKGIIGLLLLLWLLFLPNAPYILTDFIHLRQRYQVPMWFDAVLIFSFAITGLFSGIVSLYIVHRVMRKIVSGLISNLTLVTIFILSGFGVYLGRVERWNSWDLFTNPAALLKNSLHNLDNTKAISMTLVFALITGLSYFVFYYLTKERLWHNTDKE